jgi:hypothetical protein
MKTRPGGNQELDESRPDSFRASTNGVIDMMQWKRALACGALLLSGSFAAQATETTTFSFLTGIQDTGSVISLTGVPANTTTPTTLTLPGGVPDRCANLFLAMLSNPGTYNLTVVTDTEVQQGPFGPR